MTAAIPSHCFQVTRSTTDDDQNRPSFTVTIIGGHQAIFDQLVQELTQRVIGWDSSNNQLKKL